MQTRLSKLVVACGLAMVAALLAAGANAGPVTYAFVDLGPNGNAMGINNAGQVVGQIEGGGGLRATLFSTAGGASIDLGGLGGTGSYAYSVNTSGQVVGGAQLPRNPNGTTFSRATLFSTSGEANIDLGTLGGSISTANDINDSGQVVGWAYTAENSSSRAALFSTSGRSNVNLDPLGTGPSVAAAINNRGQVVGYASAANGRHLATLFSTSGGPNVNLGTLGGVGSEALDINDSGLAVGYLTFDRGGSGAVAFNTSDGASIQLDSLGGDYGAAWAINNGGQAVGFSMYAGSNTQVATMWNGTAITDLNTLLSATDVATGWSLVGANDINDNGWIIGTARNGRTGEYHAYLLTVAAIPEPDTCTLMLAALVVLGLVSSRRGVSSVAVKADRV